MMRKRERGGGWRRRERRFRRKREEGWRKRERRGLGGREKGIGFRREREEGVRRKREMGRERERERDPTFLWTPQPAGLSLQPSLQSPFFVSIGLCLIHYINSNFDISRVRDIGVGQVFQIEIDNVFYIMR